MSLVFITGYLLVLSKLKIKIQGFHNLVSLGSETFGQGIRFLAGLRSKGHQKSRFIIIITSGLCALYLCA